MKVKHLILVLIVVAALAIGCFYLIFQFKAEKIATKTAVVMEQGMRTVIEGPPKDPFSSPLGVAVADIGYICIADSGSNRVRVFDPAWQLIRNIGQFGTKMGQFGYPAGVAINSQGDLFVSEVANNRIQVFSASGAIKTKFPERPADLKGPTAITIGRNDKVIVFDRGDQYIKVFDPNGKLLFKFGGEGGEPGKFSFAMGITETPGGDILVSDSGNRRIQFFDQNGKFKSVFYGGVKLLSQFGLPRGIAAINDDRFIVVDALARTVFDVVRKGKQWDVKPLEKDLVLPDGVTYKGGKIYIIDRGGNRLVVINDKVR